MVDNRVQDMHDVMHDVRGEGVRLVVEAGGLRASAVLCTAPPCLRHEPVLKPQRRRHVLVTPVHVRVQRQLDHGSIAARKQHVGQAGAVAP